MLLNAPVFSQSTSSNQTPALLEVKFEYCIEGCVSYKSYIYADDRFVLEGKDYRKAKSGKFYNVSRSWETQLDPDELSELVCLVEQPDFLKAQPEYALKIVQDNADTITVTYRKEGYEKRIVIGNYYACSDIEKGKLPPSLLKLIKWWEEFPNIKAN